MREMRKCYREFSVFGKLQIRGALNVTSRADHCAGRSSSVYPIHWDSPQWMSDAFALRMSIQTRNAKSSRIQFFDMSSVVFEMANSRRRNHVSGRYSRGGEQHSCSRACRLASVCVTGDHFAVWRAVSARPSVWVSASSFPVSLPLREALPDRTRPRRLRAAPSA